jgi:hypothetical protein
MPEPKSNSTATFKEEPGRFIRILEDCALAGDYARITTSADNITFESRSEENALKYNAEIPKDRLLHIEVKEPEVKAAYHLGFLLNLMKNLPKGTAYITFSYANETPVHISTGVYDKLDFYIAPRIEVD